jgi:CxxC-x17-CxxC domain-containing protein
MGNFQGRDNRGGGFNKGGFGGGRPSFQKKSWGSDRGGDRGEVTMHSAVCSECGKTCEVPFRPNGDKPVFCNDCFGSKREGGDRAPRRDFSPRPAFKKEFSSSAPRADFARPAAPANDETKKQLGEMTIKLDRLINTMERFMQSSREVTPVASFVVGQKADMKKMPAKTEVKAVVKTAAKPAAKKAPVKKVVAKKKK